MAQHPRWLESSTSKTLYHKTFQMPVINILVCTFTNPISTSSKNTSMVWPINHVETEISVPRNTYITIIVKILYATQKLKFTLICSGMIISFASMVYCSLSVTLCFWFRVCLPVLHICTVLTAQLHTVPTLLQAYIIWEQNSPVQFKWHVQHVQKKEIWCSRQLVLYIYPSNSAIFKCTWNCAMNVTCYTDIW